MAGKKGKHLFPEITKKILSLKGLADYDPNKKINWISYDKYYGDFFAEYLHYKYHNVCMFNYTLHFADTNKSGSKSKQEILIENDNKYYHILQSNDIINFLRDDINRCKRRFIIFPITILAHQNIIIYDTKLKELELFDPQGRSSLKSLIGNPKVFKTLKDNETKKYYIRFMKNYIKNIEKLFKELLGGFKFFKPIDFFPQGKEFQDMEIKLCPKENFNINAEGFCTVWSFWYAEMRVSHPDVPRKLLVKELINQFEKELINQFEKEERSFKKQKNSQKNSLVVKSKVISKVICKVIRGYTSFLVNLTYNKSFMKRNLQWLNSMKARYLLKIKLFLSMPSIQLSIASGALVGALLAAKNKL